jgi:hypothetical protein
MDQGTQILVKLITERVMASGGLLADFHRKAAETEQLIEDSRVAIAVSLGLFAKPLQRD